MAIRHPRGLPHIAQRDGPSAYDGQRMSETEYLALPEVKPYLEYVDGVVRQKPMVNAAHRRLVNKLSALLEAYIEAHGGDAGPEGRVRMAPNFRLPDNAYWAPGRPSGDDSLPSVAVEVRSPNQPLRDLRDKCRAFRAAGVETCWLIDPEARTAELFEDERDAVPVTALESSAMPGFAVALADLCKVLDR
jgi:Uma2 family endonuclease